MPDEPEPTKGDEAKFSQADIDRIVADRLKREANKYADYADLKAKAEKLDEMEAASKTELDKLRDELNAVKQAAATEAAKALRLEVAAEKGVKARWLTGATREELEAAADEYLADHPPATGDKPTPTKPAEDLRGGGDPTEEPTVDIRKVVADIPRV